MSSWRLVPDGYLFDYERCGVATPDPAEDAELMERGGRAICEADGHDWDKLGSDDYHRRERQAIYKRQFIAALRALRGDA